MMNLLARVLLLFFLIIHLGFINIGHAGPLKTAPNDQVSQQQQHTWTSKWAGALMSRHRSALMPSRIAGRFGAIRFPTKAEYLKFWKKVFIFDVVANVARVGGGLLLYIFAPDLYKLLPASGWLG